MTGRALSIVMTCAVMLFLAAGTVRAADLVLDHVDIVDVVRHQVIHDGRIVIENGLITYVGPRTAAMPQGRLIDATGLVALPGFIDAHTHLWQHAVRGLKTGGDLQSWSYIVHQFLHYATRREMYEATYAAARQALLAGVTTVADFASAYSDFTYDATSAAIRDAGLDGVVIWWNPAVFLPPDVKRAEMRRLAKHIAPLRLWVAQGHAFLFDLPVLYEGVRLAGELDLGLSEHTMETIGGIAQAYRRAAAYLERYGARLDKADRARLSELVAAGPPPSVNRVYWMRRLARQVLADPSAVAALDAGDRARLQDWAKQPAGFSVAALLDFLGAFDLAHHYVSIHSVWIDDAGIALYAKKGVCVAYNPESNMRLSSGIAPLWQFRRSGVDVGLGTDGAASNDGISMLRTMRAAWNLQKMEMLDASETAKEINAWSILDMATLGAAKVLGMADQTGSINVGKQADLVLLSERALSMSPVFDTQGHHTLVPMIIYSANARAIDMVISNGKIVVDGGHFTSGPSATELATRLNAVANAVMARQAAGKTWAATYDVGAVPDDGSWFRYRSVRDVDTLALTLTNSGAAPRSVLLAFSGVPEGGATAPMLSAATLARFPLDKPKRYWSRRIELAPGATITIDKPKGGYAYTVAMPGATVHRTGAAEQLLILVKG